MRYRMALHQSEEGFAGSVPGLPGCWSQASLKPKPSTLSRTLFASILPWSTSNSAANKYMKLRRCCSLAQDSWRQPS